MTQREYEALPVRTKVHDTRERGRYGFTAVDRDGRFIEWCDGDSSEPPRNPVTGHLYLAVVSTVHCAHGDAR